MSGADLGFYKDGCRIHLKGAPEVERRRRRGGVGSVPHPQKILYFLYQNGEFLCIPGIFIDTNCKPLRKKTLDTLDTPLDPPLYVWA